MASTPSVPSRYRTCRSLLLDDGGKPGLLDAEPDHLALKRFHLALEIGEEEGVKMEYTIVIERAPGNYAAYVPDLPGCVATGPTHDEAIRAIRAAIVLHIESLREYGEPVPAPQCTATVVEIAA